MTDKYSDTEAGTRHLLATLRGIVSGKIEILRITATERLTLLLSAIALASLAAILATAVVVFVSIGAAHMLEKLSPHGAYFIVAGFYALLLVLLLALRRRLIVDPICRLVSRLILDPPESTENEQTNE